MGQDKITNSGIESETASAALEQIRIFINSNRTDLISEDAQVEIITARRGAITALVRSAGLSAILKMSSEIDASDSHSTQHLIREANITRALGAIIGDIHLESGHSDSLAWLILRAVEEPNASTLARQMKESIPPERQRQAFVELASAMAEKLVTVHDFGYLHGDLQPAHFLIEPKTHQVTIIDWACARHRDEQDAPYDGAFVHFAAPEVAAQMLLGNKRIPYSIESEIYAFGSVLYFMHTGQTSCDYGPEGLKTPFSTKLNRVANGHLRNIDFPDKRLGELFKKALSHDPLARFSSMKKFCDELRSIVNN